MLKKKVPLQEFLKKIFQSVLLSNNYLQEMYLEKMVKETQKYGEPITTPLQISSVKVDFYANATRIPGESEDVYLDFSKTEKDKNNFCGQVMIDAQNFDGNPSNNLPDTQYSSPIPPIPPTIHYNSPAPLSEPALDIPPHAISSY